MQTFILLSRCAGENASAYRIRFSLIVSEFEDTHKGITDKPIADGVLLTSLGGDRLYASYRGL